MRQLLWSVECGYHIVGERSWMGHGIVAWVRRVGTSEDPASA